MQFAYQFPERVSRLGLIGSGGLGPELTVMLRAATLPGSPTIVAALSQLPGWLTRQIIPGLSVITGWVSRYDSEAVSDALIGLRHTARRRHFLATARGVINWKGQVIGAARQLSQLGDVPVMAVWGSDDKTIPPHHQRNLVQHVAHARLLEIRDAGHFPHETHPVQVLAALLDFLQTPPSGPAQPAPAPCPVLAESELPAPGPARANRPVYVPAAQAV
jgi:pimeloyl-ACP methyl ester carboxylesterase